MSKNVLSIEAFADWCEAQGDREYPYTEIFGCAACQYLRQMGFPVKAVSSFHWRDNDGNAHDLPSGWAWPLNTRPHTFPALAARLRSSGGQTDG